MKIPPTNATLGAVVQDVDLVRIDDEMFRSIQAVWHLHAVLVFEAQDLTSEQHLAFSRRFGRLELGLV